MASEIPSSFIKGRGSSWKPAEIVDLLSIWGAEKVQQQLRRSHRNFECFVAIAREMRRRGHKRTAEECRRKTKGLRLDYKRALSLDGPALLSGSKAICPYFEELHSILRGDPSVTPRRLGKRRPEAEEGSEAGPSAAFSLGPQDLLLDELPGLDVQGHRDPSPSGDDDGEGDLDAQGGDAQGGDRSSPKGVADADAGEDVNSNHSPAEDLLFEAPVGEGTGEDNSNHRGSNEQDYDVCPPPRPMEPSSSGLPTCGLAAYQSPATRLAALRTKRKGFGPRELVERVIRHATTESRRAREAAQEMDQALLRQSTEELQRIERAEQECREHRERLLSIFERQTALLEALVSHLCTNPGAGDPRASNRTQPQMGSPKRGLSPPCDPEMAEHWCTASGGDVSFDVGVAHPATTPPQTSTLAAACQEPETAHKAPEIFSP